MRGRVSRLSLRTQLLAMFVLLLLAGIALLVADEISQRRTQQSQRVLMDQSLAGMRRMMAMSDAYAIEIVDAAWKLRDGAADWAQTEQVLDSARVRIDLHWRALQALPRRATQQAVFEQLQQVRAVADQAVERLARAVRARDGAAVRRWIRQDLFPAIDPVTSRLRYLSDLELIAAERLIAAEDARLTRLRVVRASAFLLLLVVVAWAGRGLLRDVYRGLESLVGLARALQRGNFERAPRYRPRGELGELFDVFLTMRTAIRANEDALRSSLASNERVRSELAIREEFQRSLLDAAQTAILSVDAQGYFTHVNPFAEALLGYPAEALVGKATPGLLYEATALAGAARTLSLAAGHPVASDWRVFQTLAERAGPAQEWTVLRADGSAIPVLQAVSAMHDADGRLSGLLFVITDLTEAKKLEAELRRSEARAQEASQAKSAFLAAMSHEIRTPMIGVTGMVEVLGHSALDPEQRRALNVIRHSAQALLQIIGDILDFSKIEANRLELSPQPVRLRPLLGATVANFLGSASSKGLGLSLAIEPGLAPAHRIDPLRVRQIVANFLANAIKFTERGGIEVRLVVEAEDAQAQQVRIEVEDSGIGIDADAQRRLFEPFTQADSSTARRFGGSGLGLSISRRLAELMGGSVAMRSTEGVGTCMSFRFPAPRANPDEVESQDEALATVDEAFEPLPLPDVASAERERRLVLLVDDHPTNRLVLGRQLALAGFACETAEDGESGLRAWRSGRYALLLSDVHMPRMDGYALARAIRAEELHADLPHTPIVAITAAATRGEAERCLEAGMDDFLTKPVSTATLARHLRRWLPDGRPLAAPPVPAATAVTDLPQLALPPSPLDAAALAEVAGSDADTQAAILQEFLQALQDDLGELAEADAGMDAAAAGRVAHKIKGAARLVGASEIAAAALALEQAGRRGESATIRELLPALRTAGERLRLHLQHRSRS